MAFTNTFVNGDLYYPTSSFKPTKRNAVIRGLLVSRQDFCDPDWVVCEEKCCPLRWNCCSDGNCCQRNTYCFLASNGNIGCCDDGEICSGPVGPPTTILRTRTTTRIRSTTVPIVPTTTRTRTTVPTTTTTRSTIVPVRSTTVPVRPTTVPVPVPTTTSARRPTTVPLPLPTITATATQAVTPIPTDSVARLPGKITVNSTDPRIQYQGPGWKSARSTCDSEVTAMNCQEPLSYLSFRFEAASQGGSVFLSSSQGPDAGVYVVSLDNEQTKLDGYTSSAENSCAFTYSKRNLSPGFYNLTVSFVGKSPQSSSQSQGSFEINSIQLASEGISGGRSLLAEINCAAVFFAVLLHILFV